MTSNEALEKLLHSHICYDCTAEKECCKTCHSRLCYEAVKKDLDVLEIIKKHQLIKNEAVYLDKKEWNKVKEWLEK